MADYPDDWDEDGPPFPWTINVAGYTWVALGCLGVIASLALLVWAFKPDGACVVVVIPAVGATLGGLFIYAGWSMALGRPRDTLRFGLWSAGFSLFFFGIAAVLLLTSLEVGIVNSRILTTVGFFFAIGSLFAFSGTLAIACRAPYRKWRAYFRPPANRPTDGLEDGVAPREDTDQDLNQ